MVVLVSECMRGVRVTSCCRPALFLVDSALVSVCTSTKLSTVYFHRRFDCFLRLGNCLSEVKLCKILVCNSIPMQMTSCLKPTCSPPAFRYLNQDTGRRSWLLNHLKCYCSELHIIFCYSINLTKIPQNKNWNSISLVGCTQMAVFPPLYLIAYIFH